MKLSKTKIREILFEHLEDFLKVRIINVNIGDGYFLFNLGKNSVVHFEIKEIPDWKFGLWITPTEDKKSFIVEMFGQRVDYIDKFKPTATKISEETKIPKNKEWVVNCDYAVMDFRKVLMQLKKARKITEYNLYFNEFYPMSFFKWLIDDTQDVLTYKWTEFHSKYLYKYRVKLITKAIKMIYHKYVEDVTIIENDNWRPRYDVRIHLKDDVSDTIRRKLLFTFEYKGLWQSWGGFLKTINDISYFVM